MRYVFETYWESIQQYTINHLQEDTQKKSIFSILFLEKVQKGEIVSLICIDNNLFGYSIKNLKC